MSEAFFPHMWRLELVGRVLREAFRTNFRGSGGRSRTALTHRSGEDSSQALAISLRTGNWQRDWCITSSSSSTRKFLTAPVRALRLRGKSCIRMESTRTAGLNFILCLFFSSRRWRSATFLTPGSCDISNCSIFDACSFLCSLTRDGRARPPLLAGRKRMEVLACLAKPAHFLRVLVAIGCSSRSNQEMGKTSISRGHDSLSLSISLSLSLSYTHITDKSFPLNHQN